MSSTVLDPADTGLADRDVIGAIMCPPSPEERFSTASSAAEEAIGHLTVIASCLENFMLRSGARVIGFQTPALCEQFAALACLVLSMRPRVCSAEVIPTYLRERQRLGMDLLDVPRATIVFSDGRRLDGIIVCNKAGYPIGIIPEGADAVTLEWTSTFAPLP